MANITLFSQIISKLDRSKFNKIVSKKQTDKHNKGFNSWNHLVSMLFCQFAKSQSVRDISNGLRSATGNLNHLGISKAPSKSSISYQKKNRSHELFKEYYFEINQKITENSLGVKTINKNVFKFPEYFDNTITDLDMIQLFDYNYQNIDESTYESKITLFDRNQIWKLLKSLLLNDLNFKYL